MNPGPAAALHSPLLTRAGFRHAFFKRTGGVSQGRFASLNLSMEVGDQAEGVAENLRRAAAQLGLQPGQLCWARQVHGASVVPADARDAIPLIAKQQADAVWSGCDQLACCVRTADCIPLLLACPASGRCAAVHAGWRGVTANIAKAAVQELVRAGSESASLIAALGPHISQAAFEVGPEVAAQLERCAPEAAAVEARGPSNRIHVSLAALVRAQLLRCGLRAECIERVEGCTFSNRAHFFSYRRDGRGGGQHLSAIVARRPA